MNMRACWLALALGCALLTGPERRPEAARAQEKKMSSTFYQSSREDTRAPAKPPVTIRDAIASWPAEPAGGTECLRRFCNSERNSRSPFARAPRAYRQRWRAELSSQLRPAYVVAAGDRAAVVGLSSWALLDDSGALLHEEPMGDGEAVLDPGNDLVYFPNTNGRVAADSLRDGRQSFFLSVYFGDSFARAFIHRVGSRVIVLSIEQPTDPLRLSEPTLSVIEAHELQTPFVLSEVGRLKSAREVNHLFRDTVKLLAAMHDDRLVLATTDRVYTADVDLRLERELTGSFEPLQLSLDGSGRIYLVVRAEGALFLWALTTEGERVLNVRLPAELDRFDGPPIVGFDHRVYLVSGQRIRAIDRDGTTVWEHLAAYPVAGALITAGHELLVSAGSQVAAFDGKGDRSVLFEATGETLLTPPVLTRAGELLIASSRHLYCLAAR
jgi:hypothetical protein